MSNKRGVSPVIATVLLIAIVVVLALIIFIWASNFLPETITKSGELIENSCGQIVFDAEAVGGNVIIVNKGNIPLYGAEIRKRGFGEVESIGVFGATISSGETDSIDISGSELNADDEIVIVPVIIGESDSLKKAYTCDESYGISTTVA